jgi:hypothetical protein
MFVNPVRMNHDGQSPGIVYLSAYPDCRSVNLPVDPGRNVKFRSQAPHFGAVSFLAATDKGVDAPAAAKVDIVGAVFRGMNLFAGEDPDTTGDIPADFYSFQGRLVFFMIRNGKEIKAPFPVIGCHNSRRFFAIGITGMDVHIPHKGPKPVEILFHSIDPQFQGKPYLCGRVVFLFWGYRQGILPFGFKGMAYLETAVPGGELINPVSGIGVIKPPFAHRNNRNRIDKAVAKGRMGP